MHHDLVDVLIIEDENELARLHAELIQKHPRMRLAGTAASLSRARQMLNAGPPQLVLLDNYLPDGKGVTLMTDPLLANANCSVIFITAASDMETLQPGDTQWRLRLHSQAGLMETAEPVAGALYSVFMTSSGNGKIVDQQNVDSLYQLQAKKIFRADNGSKGIEEKTTALVQKFISWPRNALLFQWTKWSAKPD